MITFKQSDLAELENQHSYLSDVIIEFYFTYLSSVHQSDSILFVPPSISFLLSNSTDDGVIEDCLKSLELPSKNLIFFTVHRCNHWSLLVYHRESDRFVHHDSSMGMNDGAAREFYLSVKNCVHGKSFRIKSRTRRCNGSRYEGSQMWPEKNDYECGSYGFPWMGGMDGPRFVSPQMRRKWKHYDCGSLYDPRMLREISQMQREMDEHEMWREWNYYDSGSSMQREISRMQQEKNEDEDDCGLYEGPQMLREKNDNDDSIFSDDYDCNDAFDCGSSVSPSMRGEKNKYDCGSYTSSRMQRENDEYDCGLRPRIQREKNGLFICPKTPQQKNGFDCGLYVMAIAEAICKWFCEEDEEKSWIGKINDMVDDSLIFSMRTCVLELIRDASSGGLETVSCTIEEEKSVGVCSKNSDASRGLGHGVVTLGGNKEVVTIGENKEETDEVDNIFWEDLNWSSDEDDCGTISDGDDCVTISEGFAELRVEEGENDCRTLCGSPPPLIAVGEMVANSRDSGQLMEEETANGNISTEVLSLVSEEAVTGCEMVEPSPSCDVLYCGRE